MSKLNEITLKNKHREFKKEHYYFLVIKVLIEMKLKTKINVIKEKWARSHSGKCNAILLLLRQKIKK